MSKITIAITFENTGKGQVTVSLLGPKSYSKSYPVKKNNKTTLDLADGLYAIKVFGTSGTKTDLSVTDASGKSLLNTSAPGPGININAQFAVNTAPELIDEEEYEV